MNRSCIKWIGFSTLSAVLLSIPWHFPYCGWILLVALIPLLWVEADFSRRGIKGCWKYYALTFLMWNTITTWWICKATLWGGVVAVAGNALQMFLVFALFRLVKKKTGDWIGYLFLIALWIAWEYFYFDAEMSWPWLVLGNGFAETTFLVQWYEFTGVLGGTLWVFLSNILILKLIKERKRIVIPAVILVLPVLISLFRFYTYDEKSNPIEVVVLQPNIDPYNEKFEEGLQPLTQEEQDQRLLAAAQQAVRPSTRYIFAPETAISSVEESNMMYNASIVRIYQFLQEYPHVTFVTGATSIRFYSGDVAPTKTARQRGGSWYDVFNAAFQLSVGEAPLVYHKSKLVPGAEKVPYAKYLKFTNKLMIDLGGAFGSLGTQPEATVFPAPWNKNHKMGVAICYESVYGEYFASYVKKGARFMAVITNDDWWGNSLGYRQHLSFSRLRAIETRRSIARSANTGISAFINQRGDYTQKSEWWTQGWLREEININHKLTFYTRSGDLIGRLSVYLLVLLLIYWLALFRLRR
ncbi:MAG: apolipoprotein N-acyltransferase [Bacteroidales bacterium]|nr:apolipoprotein N-acyltransferase [Bacteroidales bacterium]